MLTRERKLHIQAVLQRDGRVVAKSLSEELGLSEDTIRRDLRELAGAGLLQRVHGGALPASPAMGDFAARQQVASNGKARVGRAAAAMVQPGQVVFVDGGTTAVQLARHLPTSLRATVVTHSPSVAVELVSHSEIEVELIGGRLFKHSLVAIGASAMEAILRVRADVFFMGVTGVHAEAGLTTGDAEEAAVKRSISRQCGETVVLASHEKLGAASPFRVLALQQVDALVIDGDPPVGLSEALNEAGVSVIEVMGG
ncbi:MAG: DeoR/GlpR family DNA-binding transcription regulator [Caulobacteraceae bacterium]